MPEIFFPLGKKNINFYFNIKQSVDTLYLPKNHLTDKEMVYISNNNIAFLNSFCCLV